MPEMIADNIKSVMGRITKCCEHIGRPGDSVRLIAVSKEASLGQMEEALGAGITAFGENRVQDALIKHRAIGDRAQWHMIGHLQTNKARDAVKIFSLIHSVDSLKLAEEIDRQAARIGKRQSILVQVNVSGEKSKSGISPKDAVDFLKEAVLLHNISITGLMTIAPEVENAESVRPYFKTLKDLLLKTRPIVEGISDEAEFSSLSMGMTNDFEVAIGEGSNMVRIGRAIFKHD